MGKLLSLNPIAKIILILILFAVGVMGFSFENPYKPLEKSINSLQKQANLTKNRDLSSSLRTINKTFDRLTQASKSKNITKGLESISSELINSEQIVSSLENKDLSSKINSIKSEVTNLMPSVTEIPKQKMTSSVMHIVGYFGIFIGLFIVFEGFGFSLFIKILISMVLGFALATSGLVGKEYIIAIKPIGSKLFMNGLTMSLVPLVFASILTGVTSLGDIKKLNRIGMRTIIYYTITTGIAITIGLGMGNMVKPGSGLSDDVMATFNQNLGAKAESTVAKAERDKQSFFEGLVSIVPKNIMNSMSEKKPDMLAIIFFAMFSGIALLQIEDKFSQPVIAFFTGITEMTIKIIIMIMRIAPYGVFALIASIIAETESIELLKALVPFSLTVIAALMIHLIVMNGLSLKFLSKTSPIDFFKNVKSVMITAFSTSSSGATMPFTLETVEEKLKVKGEVAGFVIPLGATINMDGTALFQGVSALFLANIYGISLTMSDQLSIVFLAVAASIGTAAVPGVGIVILTMILVSVGIPPEGILFILPVNNLLDMFRTAVNVTGDMACSVYIDSFEKRNS